MKIRTRETVYDIQEGKPVIIKYKTKNKSRAGISTAIGWIKKSKDPKAFDIIHSCFQTWDAIEKEYPAHWTVWEGQIISIHVMTAAR